MKEHPILFSPPMVNAILEGRKTQTRRVVKDIEPDTKWRIGQMGEIVCKHPNRGKFGVFIHIDDDTFPQCDLIPCPFGKPSDRLWVRETWADVNTPDGPAICYRADGNYMHWRDFSKTFGPDYGIGPSMDYTAYPGDYCMWWEDLLNGAPDHRWRPSIFMPRWASRITLEITGIRVERLQDITEDDALAEGVNGDEGPYDQQTPKMCFESLWDSINGKRFPWSSNPFVWVVEFKMV